MGTNYYFHPEVCGHCRRSDPPIHIGKRSAGWQFGFQGFADIRSAADWRRALSGKPSLVNGQHLSGRGEIRDEYGDVLRLTEFWEMVVGQQSEELNHTDYCAKHHPDMVIVLGGDASVRDQIKADVLSCAVWKDDEGYSFSGGEFS